MGKKQSVQVNDTMPRAKEHKEIFKGMLKELEQSIKEFMRVAKQTGMSKAEIDEFLKRECNATVDEVCKNKIVH